MRLGVFRLGGGLLAPAARDLRPAAGGGVEQLVERLGHALAEQVGVGQQVAVGGDAVEHAAVVRRHADRQRLAGQQRRDGIGREHPGAGGVERRLRAGHVGDRELEAAAQLGGRHPRADRVERRRREAGDAGEPVGGDAAAGLLVGLERVGDLVQPDHRARPRRRAGRRSAAAIWLPSEVASSSSSMTETGTTARIWRSPPIDSARVISQARSAPVTVARITSLTVPPCASRTLR